MARKICVLRARQLSGLLTVLLTPPVQAEFPPGKPAPGFRLQTPQGRRIALAALRGKVVLLDFWGPS